MQVGSAYEHPSRRNGEQRPSGRLLAKSRKVAQALQWLWRTGAIALVLAVHLAAPAAYSQATGYSTTVPNAVLWDQCGWQGVRPCNANDPIFVAEPGFFQQELGCDLTLFADADTGLCEDVGVRATTGVPENYVPAWLAFQQSDQFDRISADLPLNLVPMLGTHNSYSNSFDGGTDLINLDQGFTITDQLNLGARFIRLDPILNYAGTTPIGCHFSAFQANSSEEQAELFFNELTGSNFPSNAPQACNLKVSVPFAQSLNGIMSYERPIYLAVEEIQYWLQQHPGEVVLIFVNNFYTPSEAGYIGASDLEAIFQHVLGNMMLTPNEFGSEGTLSWPTLRQIRALGKQALVMFANGPNPNDGVLWPDQGGGDNSTTEANFLGCKDANNGLVGIGRDTSKREDIGEDRSLSDVLTAMMTPLEAGQINWLDAAVATGCGYSTIDLDFLYSLQQAVDDTYLVINEVNFTTGGYFYTPGTDERPQWMIWSWLRNIAQPSSPEPAALVHQSSLSPADETANALLMSYPATSTLMTYRWQPMDPSSNLPFACAGPDSSGQFPNPGNMWSYTWAVTANAGPWNSGETECQKEFGANYHFWRPMSAPENELLSGQMSTGGIGQVWLNHYSGETVALPSTVTLNHGLGAPQTPINIVVTSGFGGGLTASFAPENPSFPNFLSISQAIPGSNMFQITANDQNLMEAKTGSYTGIVTITEQHPDGSAATSSQVLVVLNFTQTSLIASPADVNFVSSLTQTVQLTSSPSSPAVSFTYDQSQTPSWLTVSFSSMTTPATMTLTANLSAAPQLAASNLTVTPTNTSVTPATVGVTLATVTVSLSANVPGLPMTVDETSVPQGLVTWVIGSSHELDVPPVVSQSGTIFQFNAWTGSVESTTLPLYVTAPTASASYLAQYATYYALTTLASPQGSGT
ncbi:MAG TPA: hypothetical protein VME43_16340, partial [Bryobacteraceae bacterium]|nr:hypothetical protein [Bryobacteraceae bacterium]